MAIAGILLALSVASTAQGQARADGGNDAKVLNEFETRVSRYLEQRKQKAGTLPASTKSAARLTETREQVRSRIQANRANASQGDIFTPEVANYLRRQIARTFQGPGGHRVLISLQHAEPGYHAALHVNESYPDGIPLQSMPPTLLMKLPKLPAELQYRIVGRNLVLLDIEPNLVVDLLPDAVPAT